MRTLHATGRGTAGRLVDEPDQRDLSRTDVPVVHYPETGVVHLRDRPAGSADRLDVGDVAPPALPCDHDGADRGGAARREAVRLRVAVPGVCVAHPWDV